MIKAKKRKPTGIILWKGKSLLDGESIMAIATGVFGKSKNPKTGDMIQTYILRTDIDPILARRLGEDKSLCGDCKHKEHSTCYVNLGQGPKRIFKAFHNDSYREWQDGDSKYFKNRHIRFGSYGDPASVPFEVWNTLAKNAKDFTGYTHQWKKCDQRLKQYCMASVDSIKGFNKEFFQAQLMGWRTFRIRESLDNELCENEFVCPASKEAGVLTSCEKCNACNGTSQNRKKSPVIMMHTGLEMMGMREKYIKMMKAIRDKKKYRIKDYKETQKKFKKVCSY